MDMRGGKDENSFTLKQLDTHPDIVFHSWFSDPLVEEDDAEEHETLIRNRLARAFRDFLALYVQRQGEDDNFTLRVVDNRTDELLEIHELNREDWENRALDTPWDWDLVDEQRRRQTRVLVDKYVDQGIPRRAVTVKWGRRNQVVEARMRELAYIEYEVRLAKLLGLSLLVTETGTVETFNRDDLVSAAGARGRYQIMPFLLRLNDIYRYRLGTAAGNTIRVYEERHPLLTMETAFTTIAGYRNAVGHEIPGLSAYHSGPGNIFMLYRTFLEEGGDFHTRESTVMDAYIWAITDGFDKLSSSSFRNNSRGYVASAYGSLRATESLPVDKTATAQVERVQFRSGERITLSRLLQLLPDADLEEANAYDRFREHNPHFLLSGTLRKPIGRAARRRCTTRFSLREHPCALLPSGRLDQSPVCCRFRRHRSEKNLPLRTGYVWRSTLVLQCTRPIRCVSRHRLGSAVRRTGAGNSPIRLHERKQGTPCNPYRTLRGTGQRTAFGLQRHAIEDHQNTPPLVAIRKCSIDSPPWYVKPPYPKRQIRSNGQAAPDINGLVWLALGLPYQQFLHPILLVP